MNSKELLAFLSNMNVPHVSGYERGLLEVVSREFSKYARVYEDKFGNLIAHKEIINESGKKGPKIMISAHADEIGLMVLDLCEGGFVKFTPIGGVDKRCVLAQEVTIHGNVYHQGRSHQGRQIYGVIGIKPPHLTTPSERQKTIEFHDMAIDTGYPFEELKKLIKPGDIITFNQGITELQNGKIAGRALDNTAGIAAMLSVLKNLEHYNHNADLYFVCSKQEEVGGSGAITATYALKPDIGIVIDVGFGRTSNLAEHESIELGKGPAIAIGPNIHRKLFESLKKVAVKNNIKYQVEVLPFMSSTDTEDIQISGDGVSTALLSIPLKHMHSTVEMVSLSDVEGCGRLVSEYVISLQSKEGKE